MKLEGLFIFGECKGFVSEPWEKNGRSGINNKIGIARHYETKWGESTSEVIQIDVPRDSVEKFRNQAQMLKGQYVYIRVAALPKAGGRNGAFLTYFAPKDADLLPAENLPKPAKTS